jgi:DNA-binding MarR family transcriptional regulator
MKTISESLKQKNFQSKQLKANMNVLFTANFIANEFSDLLMPFQISNEQYNVLRILRGSYPAQLEQHDVENRMISCNANLTLSLNKLALKGWVSLRITAFKADNNLVSITDAGLKLLEKLDHVIDQKNQSVNKLTNEEAEMLSVLLDKMRS